jgi:hypothetical protein
MADGQHEATNNLNGQLSDGQYDFPEVLKVFPQPLCSTHWLADIWMDQHRSGHRDMEWTGCFLGVLLALARKGYSPKSATNAPTSYDGEVALTGVSPDGAPIAQIQLTEDAQRNFLTKPVLTIKGFDENA